MKKLTLEQISDSFILSCKRFPISIFFLLWLAVSLIYFGSGDYSDAKFFNIFYPASTALLTCALRLWEEEVENLKRCRIIQGAIHACWLAIAVYISFYCDMNQTVQNCVYALSFTIAIAFFIVPFFKENEDISLWKFTFHTFLISILSFAVAQILMGGVLLLLESFRQLFGLVLWDDAAYDVAVICNGFIAPFLFLQLIPKHDKMHNDSLKGLPKFMYGIIHYLFIPLTAAYLITLYAYAVKILFQWELPEGWVSWLVTVLMTLMTIIIIAVYPSKFSEGHNVDKKIVKWLPMFVLPLLLLMSIGILRRISDYGITVNRLYISLFNLWCYGVCIWLIVSKARRIVWIPISFTVLLLLSSVGPQNFSSLAFSYLKSDVIKGLKMTKVAKLPMDFATYKKWIKQKDASMGDIINNLYYLKSQFGNKVLTDIADSLTLERINSFGEDKRILDIEINTVGQENTIMIPYGYKHVIPAYCYNEHKVKVDGDKISFIVEYAANGKKLKLPIDVSIKKLKSIENSKYIEPVKCSNAVLYFSVFSFYENTETLYFYGTIFY